MEGRPLNLLSHNPKMKTVNNPSLFLLITYNAHRPWVHVVQVNGENQHTSYTSWSIQHCKLLIRLKKYFHHVQFLMDQLTAQIPLKCEEEANTMLENVDV